MLDAKPIALIRLNSEIGESSSFNYNKLVDQVKLDLPDYNVLVVFDNIEESVKLEVFYSSDITEITFKELETLIKNTLDNAK